jgi:segregation and condensation protein A
MKEDYKIELEIFEGPLDLLLYLIRREELNIYDIPINRITEQYLAYLELMQMLDLNIAGEFVKMAATLMYIKSRTLLPPEEREPDDGEEPVEDPRMDLVRQLIEYKKFKEAAEALRDMESEQTKTFSRTAELDIPPEMSQRQLVEVSIFDLLSAFSDVLTRAMVQEDIQEIFEEEVSIADKIKLIVDTLRNSEKAVFENFFAEAASKIEIVVTFLAMLELIRLKRIVAYQRSQFGEIELILRE